MHKSITFIVPGLILGSFVGCNSQQKTEIPATPIQPAPAVAEESISPIGTLAIGDYAPTISIDHWVKGDEIDGFEDGQVYVMEFWATWCPPCITSMPHLSGLQEEYGDSIKIIGVSSEKDLETVTGFLAKTNKSDNKLNNERMRYTVAVDPDKSTSASYMKAAGQNGIPTAFIINADGKVAWIGHPMTMDKPLSEIVEGTWDLAAAADAFDKKRSKSRAMAELNNTYSTAVDNKDWDAGIAAIDAYIAEHNDMAGVASMKFFGLLNDKKDKEAAYAWGRVMLESESWSPQTLNSWAWTILDKTPKEMQDLDFALDLAAEASDRTKNENSNILDTLARAYWELGDMQKAVTWQKKAVSFAKENSKTEMQATLDEYKEAVVIAEVPAAKPTPEPNQGSLSIGDYAPTISIDHWVKGDEIDGFEDGQVYVMEFWATWCGPCITSMPHLSGLQEKYGDSIKIIGVSSEKDLETVTGFLAKTNKSDNKLNNERMRYTVAVDPDKSTSASYMKAAGQNGIPTAFIINADGKVAWIGHPMTMDKPLSEIVEGTWDLAAAADAFKKEKEQQVAMMEFRRSLRIAQIDEDWDTYISAIDAFTAEYGDNLQLAEMKFNALLIEKKDMKVAYAWAETMVKAHWDDANAMNSVAWGIVDETPTEFQNLDFALKVALRGCELTNYKDPMILDTLARCYWEMDDRYKAIVWQNKAVDNIEDGPMADSIKATLAEYKTEMENIANVDE